MPLYTHSAVLLSRVVKKYWLCGLNGVVNPFRIARALRAEQPQEQWDGLAFAELGVHRRCAMSQLFTRGQHYTRQSNYPATTLGEISYGFSVCQE